MSDQEQSLNKYGGERAKCPKCNIFNSTSYEFLAEDWRLLKCSECGLSSACALYFPKEIKKIMDKRNE